MDVRQKVHTILSGFKKMVELDPTAATAWLEEKMDKLENDEREELQREMSKQNIPVG